MIVREVDSLDIPELELYSTLREKTHHWRRGVFVAESEKVVKQLLERDIEIESMLLSRYWFEQLKPKLEDERYSGVGVFVADETLLESIVGYKLHKNLMAIGRIPPSPALEDLAWDPEDSNIHVAVEGIADSENMGTIIRNCAAFGISSLIVGSDSCSPYLRRSVRVSVGTIFSVRILYVQNLLLTLQRLHDMQKWRFVATVPRGGNKALPQLNDGEPQCIVFGSEAHGLSEKSLAFCSDTFTIPMKDGCDSLNVSNSVAVTLYEAVRDK